MRKEDEGKRQTAKNVGGMVSRLNALLISTLIQKNIKNFEPKQNHPTEKGGD